MDEIAAKANRDYNDLIEELLDDPSRLDEMYLSMVLYHNPKNTPLRKFQKKEILLRVDSTPQLEKAKKVAGWYIIESLK